MPEFKLYYRGIATKTAWHKTNIQTTEVDSRDKVIHIVHSCSQMIITKIPKT